MSDRLEGKVAIVTGGARGIGRGEVLALAAAGAKVVVNDHGVNRNGSGESEHALADGVVAEIEKMGRQAVANYDSVATMGGAERIIKTALDAFGRLDILVNNAGIYHLNDVFRMTERQWDEVVKVHLYGAFYTIRHACAIFHKQRSGRIINPSSSSGLGGIRNMKYVNYSAAKEGIVGLTRRVAREMGEFGVTCNAIRPQADTMRPGETQSARTPVSDEMRELARRMRTGAPEGLKPEDIGPLVVWLASDEAAHVTGRTFGVMTGRIALYSEPVQEKVILKVGGWTTDELFDVMPATLAADLTDVNRYA